MLIDRLADLGIRATPRKIETVRQLGLAPPLVKGRHPTDEIIAQYASAIDITGQGKSTDGAFLAQCARGFDVQEEKLRDDYITVFHLSESDDSPDWSGGMTDADFQTVEETRKYLEQRERDAPESGIARQLRFFKANIGGRPDPLHTGMPDTETAEVRRESFVDNLIVATFGGEVYNKEVFNEAGGFPPDADRNPRYLTDRKMLLALDPDVWPRIVQAARILYRAYLVTEPAVTRLAVNYFTTSEIGLELLAFGDAVDRWWSSRFIFVPAGAHGRTETGA
jgi:hypothetical protein